MSWWRLIWSNIRRRPARSLLTAAGVAASVGAVVALSGITDAFRRNFLDLYQSRGIDLVVVRAGTSANPGAKIDAALGERIAALDEVRAVAPGLVDVVSFEKEGLIGVPIQGWPVGSFLFEELTFVAGRPFESGEETPETRKVILGAILARNLSKTVGDTIEIQLEPFEIVGVYESGNVFENGSAVVPIDALRDLMQIDDQVTDFQVMLAEDRRSDADVNRVREAIEALTDADDQRLGLAALPTRDYVNGFAQLKIAEGMCLATLVVALFVGAVGMLNTMLMSVFERTREFGVLRALGWRPGRIARLVVAEAMALAFLGATLGILGAWGLVLVLSGLPGINGFLTADLPPRIMLQGVALALVAALLGGLHPARRAARLSPIEAIRHE